MHICLITEYYHPSYGGQYAAVKSLREICNFKKLNYSVIHNKSHLFKNKKLLENTISNSDVIHIFGGWTLFYLKIQKLAKKLNKKILIHTMGYYEPWSLAQKQIKKKIAWKLYQEKLLLSADTIHCASKNEEFNIKKLNPLFKTEVVPFGLKENFYLKKVLKKTNKKFLFFSRLHKKKGLDFLLKAWSFFDNTGWKLDIVGSGNLNKYKKIKLKYKLKNINFFKPVYGDTNKKKLFSKYDVLILPTQNENFGMVILEALSRGLLILTTNETPWNIIQEKKAGWIINYSFIELCLAINEIINKKHNFYSRRKRSILIAQKYEFKKVSEKYYKLYCKLAKK